MRIEKTAGHAVVSTTICDINNKEMQQMYELKNRINDVLVSHAKDSKEKKYISDDDLKLAHAIFSVFTKEYSSKLTSAFDEYLKEQNPAPQADREKPQAKIPIGDDQLFG